MQCKQASKTANEPFQKQLLLYSSYKQNVLFIARNTHAKILLKYTHATRKDFSGENVY